MRKRGPLLMALGTLLIAGAVGLSVYNRMEEARSDALAAQVCAVLERQVILPIKESARAGGADAVSLPAEAQSVTVDGGAYIGIVEIPALGLSLPVQENWSQALLKSAPCRYTGSFLKDDMIIAGHNYKRQFGGLARLENGDGVFFTDVDGNLFAYEVDSIETLDGSDVGGMAAGEWDLTLFTCTLGGQSRVTVRCVRSGGGADAIT